MANFPNDGVGYNAHAELMNKRGENRRATTLMLPSYVEAEMPVAGDALHNALVDYRDSDAQCPTRGDEYAVTLDAEMVAALNAERELEINATDRREIIYHEVDGKIVPLRVAEPGEIAATEAASGLS